MRDTPTHTAKMQEEIAALKSKGCNHNSQVYLEEVIARKNERIAELQAIIDAAPHGIACKWWQDMDCNCWKSKVGKEQG